MQAGSIMVYAPPVNTVAHLLARYVQHHLTKTSIKDSHCDEMAIHTSVAHALMPAIHKLLINFGFAGITYFNWDDEVRGLIKETLEKSAPLLLGDTHGDTASDSSPVAAGSFGNNAAVDCDAVNNATHPLGKVLDQHFRGWQTPGDGKFAQEPHEHDPPETITLDNGKQWHVVASKRNKGKGIFLVEKRLVCFREVDSDTKVQKPMVCCVKKGFKVTAESNPAALTLRQNMTKAAILRNF